MERNQSASFSQLSARSSILSHASTGSHFRQSFQCQGTASWWRWRWELSAWLSRIACSSSAWNSPAFSAALCGCTLQCLSDSYSNSAFWLFVPEHCPFPRHEPVNVRALGHMALLLSGSTVLSLSYGCVAADQGAAGAAVLWAT